MMCSLSTGPNDCRLESLKLHTKMKSYCRQPFKSEFTRASYSHLVTVCFTSVDATAGTWGKKSHGGMVGSNNKNHAQVVSWAIEMSQQVKSLTAKSRSQSCIPRTHTVEGEMWLLMCSSVCHMHAVAHMHAHMQADIDTKQNKFFVIVVVGVKSYQVICQYHMILT